MIFITTTTAIFLIYRPQESQSLVWGFVSACIVYIAFIFYSGYVMKKMLRCTIGIYFILLNTLFVFSSFFCVSFYFVLDKRYDYFVKLLIGTCTVPVIIICREEFSCNSQKGSEWLGRVIKSQVETERRVEVLVSPLNTLVPYFPPSLRPTRNGLFLLFFYFFLRRGLFRKLLPWQLMDLITEKWEKIWENVCTGITGRWIFSSTLR